MPLFFSCRPRLATVAGLALVLGAAGATAATPGVPAACASPDELAALRARVAELEARLAGQAAPAPAVSVTTTVAPVPPPAAAPGTPVPLPQVQTIVTRDGTTIRAIPLETLPEEPYSHAGCSLGFFSGPPPGKWRDASAWDLLSRDMTPAQVEDLLGVEHHDAGNAQRRVWEYGKCGGIVAGTVRFVDGRLAAWRVPDNLR